MQGPNGRFASETAAWIKKWLKIPMLEILGGDWRYSKHSSTFLWLSGFAARDPGAYILAVLSVKPVLQYYIYRRPGNCLSFALDKYYRLSILYCGLSWELLSQAPVRCTRCGWTKKTCRGLSRLPFGWHMVSFILFKLCGFGNLSMVPWKHCVLLLRLVVKKIECRGGGVHILQTNKRTHKQKHTHT